MTRPLSPKAAHRRHLLFGLVLFTGLSFIPISAFPQSQTARTLERDKAIEEVLAGGQSHSYRITLAEGQSANLVVDQRGIDIVVKTFGPDDRQIIERDSESRTQGQESVALVAKVTGGYKLEVRAKMKGATAGRYQIRIAELRAATDRDRALFEADELCNQATELSIAGKLAEAQKLAEHALAIREKNLGPEHPDVAQSLSLLANIYRKLGDFAMAGQLHLHALEIREKVFGPEHPLVAVSLQSLALSYHLEGDYEKASPLYQRAFAIRQKALSPDHPDIAESLNGLANLFGDQGDNLKAEPFYQRALVIWEKAFGPEDHSVSRALNNLAITYQYLGDYLKAEPLYQRSLEIKVKTLGPNHPDVAQSLNNFANFYNDKGDYVKAESMHKHALEIREKSLGPEHPDVAQSLNNLANTYNYLDDLAKAEPLYKRGIAIREKMLGPEHMELASTLNGLANLYRNQGRYAEAEPIYQRAIAIHEKTQGPEHFETANSLDNLAILYLKTGDLAKAEPLFRRTIAINEKWLGPKHPLVGESFHSLALLYAARGDLAEALNCQTKALMIGEHNITLNLATGSERQKLAYLAGFSSDTDFTLSLQSQAAPDNPQALNLAFTTLLRRKGRGLDAMTDTIAAIRRHASPQDQEHFDRLTEARSQLATLTLQGAQNDDGRMRLQQLEDKVEDLESVLSSHSVEFRAQTQPVTLSAVQAALPAGSALVEFAAYQQQDLRTGKDKSPRYLVYLLSAQGQPKWADLGETAPIDLAIEQWRKALRDPNRTDVMQLAREVDDKIMRPVRSLLSKTPNEVLQLLIAPDGLLNLVPFAALVDEQNCYLVERYSISYLTSGRDLLRTPSSPAKRNASLIVANPAFGIPASPAQIKSDQTAIVFQPLPGTEGEAVAIKTVLPKSKLLLWRGATETAIKRVRAPLILHIATHGFFLSNQEIPSADLQANTSEDPRDRSGLRLSKWIAHIKDPLLRSGLALAGANQRKSGDDDGVLTALEVAGLDLWGTELVVLSACDTGVGEVKNGDGVHGLRRALVLAGSKTQIMSLWPVSDRITRDWMVAYYNGLKRGEGRGEALRRVQLEMIKNTKRQHPFYWAAFIQSGEWANLEGRR
jgi:CHAT domain-containing protein/Tfp pilus assembly protein PilF